MTIVPVKRPRGLAAHRCSQAQGAHSTSFGGCRPAAPTPPDHASADRTRTHAHAHAHTHTHAHSVSLSHNMNACTHARGTLHAHMHTRTHLQARRWFQLLAPSHLICREPWRTAKGAPMTALSSVTAGPFLVQAAAQVLPVLPTAAQPHLALVAILGPIDHVRAQQGGRAHSPAACRRTCTTHCANRQCASLWHKLKSQERGLSERAGCQCLRTGRPSRQR